MGRLLVLAVLLGVMFALRSLKGESVGAHDPLILAAIGFVVMASFTAAELGSLLTLPRVTGYLTAGVLLGPSLADILSTRVVQDMTMFNTLALGLIALSAGLELDLKAQKALWRTLFSTVGAKILLAGGAVVGVLVAAEVGWGALGLDGMNETLAVGLVLGTLAVGTSPAIALAIITEAEARGRMADLTLGAAVLKDLVLVVLLAVALAVGTGLLGSEAGGHGHSGGIVGRLAVELGGSVAVGSLLGVVLIGYVRFVGAEMLLFVAGLVLAAAELSRALHLDLLLVFIAAGFVVRNFSQQWEATLHAIETVSLPVFVVFFTIAGARIDLAATTRVLPVALLLSAARAVAFYFAARIGARAGDEPPEIARYSWLAYLPQAGVTLGLLGIASEALGPVGKPLSDVGIACVAINLAIGPISLRRALQLARPAEPETAQAPAPEPAAKRTSRVSEGLLTAGATSTPLAIETGDVRVDRAIRRLRDALQKASDELTKEQIVPHGQALLAGLKEPLGAHNERAFAQRVHAWALQEHAQGAGDGLRTITEASTERLLSCLEQVPPLLTVPLAPGLLEKGPDERLGLRWRKLRARLRTRLLRRARVRRVPLRTAARVCLAQRLMAVAEQLQAELGRTHARVLEELRRGLSGELEVAEVAVAAERHVQELENTLRSDFAVAADAGLHELIEITRDIDSPVRPYASLRYSEVEPEVRQRTLALAQQASAWADALAAAEQTVVREAAVRRLFRAAEEALDSRVLLPLADAADALEPAVAKLRTQLREAGNRARETDDLKEACEEFRGSFGETLSAHERESGIHGDRFRAAAAMHAIDIDLRSLIDALPEDMRLLPRGQSLGDAGDAERVTIRAVHPRAEARAVLLDDFLPVLDLQSRRAAAAVQDFDARLTEALEMALSAMGRREDSEAPEREAVAHALELALNNLEQGTAQARQQVIAAHDAIAEAFEAAIERLALGRASGPELRVAGAALTRAMSRLVSTGGDRMRALTQRLARVLRRARGHELAERLGRRIERPQDLRSLLTRDVADAVPKGYSRLFRLEPEQDMRLCVGRERQMAQIREAHARFRAGGAATVLVLGEAGSGRTTLLNASQREIAAGRLLRPESVRSRRTQGLVRALAYELGCAATVRDVRAGLREPGTAVLIDDLEHWFAPDATGMAQLRTFLDLIRATRSQVFWIVSLSGYCADLLVETVAVEDVFSDVVRLSPLSRAELRRAVETRHALSGLTLEFPRLPLGLTARLIRLSESDVVFRVLHALSGGNPAAALSLFINSVDVSDKRVAVMLEQLLRQRLPRLSALDVEATALLVQLYRFGPMTPGRLSDSLGVPVARVRRRLTLLQDIGLLVPGLGAELSVARPWRGMLPILLPMRAERRN